LSALSKPTFDVALALVHRDGRWLVARRHDQAHLGGLWEFPGGKVGPAESSPAAALRELREECGVEAEVERVLEPFVCEYADRIVRLVCVVCRWTGGEAQPLGSQECQWATLSALRKLQMPAINAEIIREIELWA